MIERRNPRWTLGLLLALLLGHLLVLSTSERAQGNRLESLILRFFGPVGHAVVTSTDAMRGVSRAFRLAGTLREENAELRAENAELRRNLAALQGLEEAFGRLSETRGYVRPDTGEVIVADVVWVDPSSWLRTLVLYTGTAEPRRNQPVITDRGLVGRVVVSAGRYAKVLLLTDPSLAVSAMVARNRQRGLVRGGGDGPLSLEHIPSRADVRPGDEVVTAGIDGIFPRGIPIGRVLEVGDGGAGLFRRVTVVPAIDPAVLDQVFVLTQEAVPADVKEALAVPGGGDETRGAP